MMQEFQHNNKGFTFLELLMALAIFSAGLLGILQLQFLAQRQLYDAIYISRAVAQAYNLSALMIMFDDSSVIEDWNLRNAKILPEGDGQLNDNTITVSWKNPLNIGRMFVTMQHGVLP
jgi:prepilin-type N-terminal cleavage/methylation domain-containing protein